MALSVNDRILSVYLEQFEMDNPLIEQNAYSVKYNAQGGSSEPVCMPWLTDTAPEQPRYGMSQTTAGTPGKAQGFEWAKTKMGRSGRISKCKGSQRCYPEYKLKISWKKAFNQLFLIYLSITKLLQVRIRHL